MSDSRGLIILDRDGVLNRMVERPGPEPIDSPLVEADVEILPGVIVALCRLAAAGYELAIASNQPAAAKGKVTLATLQAVHARVVAELSAGGVPSIDSHVCYHRAEDGCSCRKPRTGLLEAALSLASGCQPSKSWMVGDRATDVIAGATLGLSTALLGKSSPADAELLISRAIRPSFRGKDLREFADFLLGKT